MDMDRYPSPGRPGLEPFPATPKDEGYRKDATAWACTGHYHLYEREQKSCPAYAGTRWKAPTPRSPEAR